MPATVRWNERNGAAPGSLTNGITNLNFGSVDAPNLNALNNPLQLDDYSFEKWIEFEVTAMNDVSVVKNFKVWRTSNSFGEGASWETNARESSYGGAETYADPVDTNSIVADQAMPTSEPAGANLGIGGSLTGEITAPGKSDYLVNQIKTGAADTLKGDFTFHFKYTEVL